MPRKKAQAGAETPRAGVPAGGESPGQAEGKNGPGLPGPKPGVRQGVHQRLSRLLGKATPDVTDEDRIGLSGC